MTPPSQYTRLRKATWIASAILLVALVAIAPRILARPPIEKRDVILRPFDAPPGDLQFFVKDSPVDPAENTRIYRLNYRSFQLGDHAIADLSNLRLVIQGVPETQEVEGYATIETRGDRFTNCDSSHHAGTHSGIAFDILIIDGSIRVSWGPLEVEIVEGRAKIEGAGSWELHGPERVAFFDRHGTFLDLVDVETWKTQDE